MTVGVDFDFAKWIAVRRGSQEQQQREGAAYAFANERKFRRSLALARPVSIALEVTTRLWRESARTDLLATAVKVTDQQYPRVFKAAKAAGAALRVRVPPVFAAPSETIKVKALGTEDAPHLIVNLALAERLTDLELVAALGHALSSVQNGHIFYDTALHYLSNGAAFFVRWVVQPAILTLRAWSRRAEITNDRAALLATRDLDATLRALVIVELGLERGAAFSADDYLANLPDQKRGLGRYADLFRSNPSLPARIQALRLFADSALYAQVTDQDPAGKPSVVDIDRQVAELISVL